MIFKNLYVFVLASLLICSSSLESQISGQSADTGKESVILIQFKHGISKQKAISYLRKYGIHNKAEVFKTISAYTWGKDSQTDSNLTINPSQIEKTIDDKKILIQCDVDVGSYMCFRPGVRRKEAKNFLKSITGNKFAINERAIVGEIHFSPYVDPHWENILKEKDFVEYINKINPEKVISPINRQVTPTKYPDSPPYNDPNCPTCFKVGTTSTPINIGFVDQLENFLEENSSGTTHPLEILLRDYYEKEKGGKVDVSTDVQKKKFIYCLVYYIKNEILEGKNYWEKISLAFSLILNEKYMNIHLVIDAKYATELIAPSTDIGYTNMEDNYPNELEEYKERILGKFRNAIISNARFTKKSTGE